MDVVRRADTPVMVKQVCAGLQMFTESARSEAMRSKLNRLAERGWLRKGSCSRKDSGHVVKVGGVTGVGRSRAMCFAAAMTVRSAR